MRGFLTLAALIGSALSVAVVATAVELARDYWRKRW